MHDVYIDLGRNLYMYVEREELYIARRRLLLYMQPPNLFIDEERSRKTTSKINYLWPCALLYYCWNRAIRSEWVVGKRNAISRFLVTTYSI